MASWKQLKTTTLGTVTLDSSYTAASGSMVLTAGQGARLPSTGDFWIAWSEDQGDPDAVIHLWKVTARSTDIITVTAETTEGGGDTNVSAGETLRAVMSISALDQLRQDICQTGTFASASSEKAGNLYLPNDGFYALRDSGAAMVPWGPLFALTSPPAVSSLTWVNQGSATADETYGGILMTGVADAAVNLRMLVASTPATPWTKTAFIIPMCYPGNYTTVGMVFRQSSDGKVAAGYLQVVDNTLSYRSEKFTDATTFSASYTALQINHVLAGSPGIFLQLGDDGVNRTVKWSTNGKVFHTLHSVGRTDFLTANQVGFVVYSGANTTAAPSMLILGYT